MESLRHTIDILTVTPTPEAGSLFWMRLYGVVHEMWNMHKPSENPPDTTDADIVDNADPLEEQSRAEDEFFESLAQGVFQACEDLRAAFSEDELLMIQWKRDDEAHVELEGYEPRVKKGSIDWIRRGTPIGPVHHDKVHGAVSSIKRGRDDLSVAADLAGRITDHVDRLIAALKQYPDH